MVEFAPAPSPWKREAFPNGLERFSMNGGSDAQAGGDAIHEPVMVTEIVDFFRPASGQFVLDGTIGLGGHAERFLKAGATVVGLDQDRQALAFAGERLQRFGERLTLLHGNAEALPDLLGDVVEDGLPSFDAVLFDLGASSWQLDSAARGFSFREAGPLDMRMNTESPLTAGDIVNTWPEEEIAVILRNFGEERFSRAIAREIVRRRAAKPLETTLELAELIRRCVRIKPGGIHPATRSFQGLRIAVNRELEVLPRLLEAALDILNPGGKLAVLAFHSLEDRIVKRFLRERSRPEIDDPTWPAPRPNPRRDLDLPITKAIKPSSEEIERNPRARSARLRLAHKRK